MFNELYLLQHSYTSSSLIPILHLTIILSLGPIKSKLISEPINASTSNFLKLQEYPQADTHIIHTPTFKHLYPTIFTILTQLQTHSPVNTYQSVPFRDRVTQISKYSNMSLTHSLSHVCFYTFNITHYISGASTVTSPSGGI